MGSESKEESEWGALVGWGKAYFTPLPIADAGLKIQGLRAYRKPVA